MEANIIVNDVSSQIFSNSRADDLVVYATDKTQRVLIGASNNVSTLAPLCVSATSVGINTNPSASYKLDVAGDVNVSGAVNATRYYGDGSFLTGVTGTGTSTGTGGESVWKSIYINNTSNVSVIAKVGINNTMPGVDLDVIGDMAVSGSLALTSRLKLSGIRLEKNTTGAMANVTATSALAEGVQVTTASNMIIFPKGLGGIYSSNATVTVQDAYHNTVFEVSALGTKTTKMATFNNVEFTGALTRNGMPFISGSGSGGGAGWSDNVNSVYTFSNVGIGMANPEYGLDVNADVRFNANMYFNNRIGMRGLRLDQRVLGANSANLTSMNVTGFSNLDSNVSIQTTGTSSTNYIAINSSSSSTETARFTNAGFVGIGTSTPSSKLQVTDTATFSNVVIQGRLLDNNGIPFSTSSSSSSSWSNNGANTIHTFSNVGIHTTTPQYGLDVNADVRFNSNMYFNNRIGIRGLRLDTRVPGANSANLTSMNIVGFSNLDSNVSIQTTGNSSTNFIAINSSSTNAEIARFTNQGYLGIGTKTPTFQLQLSTDSASKPATNTWTISSDARLKTDISAADLDMCYNAIKVLPLKRYTWKDDVYTMEQVADRSKLGWIAQDVELVFPKAVTRSQQHGFDDCRSLNADQLYAAMYGAIQKLQNIVETQQIEIQQIKTNLAI